MFNLTPILKKRLLQYGLDESEIQNRIDEYVGETREYISLVLPNYKLTDGQIKIIMDNYVQYKLFSMLEMESFVEDKRLFLDNIINTIKETDGTKTKGIKVF